MNRFTRLALAALIPTILFLNATPSFASGGQSFFVGGYPNAAAMMFVKHNTLSFGGNLVKANVNYTGTVGPSAQFSANSNHGYFSPTFKAYHRLNKYIIVGMAGFEPGATVLGFGDDSPAAFVNQNFDSRSYDLSPSITIQPVKWLAFAVGPDAIYRHIQATIQVRVPFVPPPTVVTAPFSGEVSGWSARWHAALMVALSKGTFVGLDYYSRSITNLKGDTTYLGTRNTDTNVDFQFPTTYGLSLTQFLSSKWLVQGKVHYSAWNNVGQNIIFKDTALGGRSIVAPLNYHATWQFSLFTRYNITPKYAIEGILARDHTPTNNKDRSLLLPEGDLLSLGLGGQIKLHKNIALELLGGYSFFTNKVRLKNPGGAFQAQTGTADLDAYWGAFDIVYKD